VAPIPKPVILDRAARLLAAIIALALGAGAALAQAGSVELAVKATYLAKFAPYVDWPKSANPSSDPFALCVAGVDPFGSLLDAAVAGQRVAGRPVVVRRIPTVAGASGCEILYLAPSPEDSITDALAATRDRPVLTVTDVARNGGPRGIINFELVDNHVRFEIDAGAAAQSGLAISSKLQSLAFHGAAGK
jgi:hypothetical protein